MIKLLMLLCGAVVVGKEILEEISQKEHKIEFSLKAGKVSLNLKAAGVFNPDAIIRVSIIHRVILCKNNF